MITCTGRDTCKSCFIPEGYISEIEELSEEVGNRAYPFSRIRIRNPKDGFEYYQDVVESKREIERLIKEKKEMDEKSESAGLNSK